MLHRLVQHPRRRQSVYLAGRAVGHARALIAGQVEVGGAGALVASARGEETKVTAAAVVGLTRVVEHWSNKEETSRARAAGALDGRGGRGLRLLVAFYAVLLGGLTLGLAVGVVNVHIHGPMQGADKGGLIGTLGFMSSVDGLCLPVGPVDILLKQSHGKDVGDVVVEDCKNMAQTRYCHQTRGNSITNNNPNIITPPLHNSQK